MEKVSSDSLRVRLFSKMSYSMLLVGMLSAPTLAQASFSDPQLPDTNKALVNPQGKILEGYWHNWCGGRGYQGGEAECIQLKDIDPAYNVVMVSFMKVYGNAGLPTFQLDPAIGMSEADFKRQIQDLNDQGRSVLISLGGADAHIELNKGQEQALADEIIRLVDTYGFDGLDIDLEQTAITAADNAEVITDALKKVKDHYRLQDENFIIAMAPEFPYLTRGNNKYAAYIEPLEGYYDWISPQFYNQGGDGIYHNVHGWIAQNNDAKKKHFIVEIAKAIATGDGFIKIPHDKLVFGIPSSVDAAATGYIQNPQDLFDAFAELEREGLPLKGIMTWSINWDVSKNSNGTPYNGSFAATYGPFIHGDKTYTPTVANDSPIIHGATATQVNVLTAFDPLVGVSASDSQDGDLTSKIQLTGVVDTSVPGILSLNYSVTDSDGNRTEVVRKVTVSNQSPVIEGAQDITIKVGDIFDPRSGVTAQDREDGNLTSFINLSGTVDSSKAGVYTVIYSVEDRFGQQVQVERKVRVLAESESGAYPLYQEGLTYKKDDLISHQGSVYRCNIPGWCGVSAWAYAPGVGLYWQQAWSLHGTDHSTSENSGGENSGEESHQNNENESASNGGEPGVETTKGSCSSIDDYIDGLQYRQGDQVVFAGKLYTAERWTDIGRSPDAPWSGWSDPVSCQ